MDKKFKIMVIQGPNINMLGVRDPGMYGSMKMEDIHSQMKVVAEQYGADIEFFQSNFEGELVDKIQECLGEVDGIIINPAAYSHTSIAIRDAISAVGLPAIEVHISNIYRREEFREKSLIAPVCAGHIAGFGPVGYHLAMIGMLQIFDQIKALEAANQNQ
ncbi:3-dehydroquinate dehydratase [Campylobacter pinnipediorum subsp. caledonicus]|uniref:3-dehydroquinate dehydratase n=1 Tax=Campylobacter pinnipediorum subsp. caledonicus TaxID=1874362 RepID=A0A1S6U8H6_9BACT|nr:type II 3-dehydroquinate dehydratase [Campylobacter pinnipediorum]AQW86332.1 3-dehydroquinate dehydratase [Campylobacter pinnipediorum subsp. caledonicus]AQW87985.1 3-dehydroquinate dehydratase [Campylobacter pinnipediorum subsp. caledonicus]OPA71430.1 type II 3-dehydroquinate dehydratase [Campylobacter pinnipediorum subsp. caledonicus]